MTGENQRLGTERVNVRVPRDLERAFRDHATERGESVSDALRRAMLRELGKCPTCGQDWNGT